MMKFGIAFIVWTSAYPTAWAARTQLEFDRPLSQQEKTFSERGETIKFKCLEYDGFSVVELNDPSQIGAKEIRVRPRTTQKRGGLCDAKFKDQTLLLELTDGYLSGVKNSLIFVDGSDSFGSLLNFSVFDGVSGKKVFEATRHLSETYAFKTNKKTIGLTFFKKLSVPCPLAQDGESCWKTVLAENRVPPSVSLKMPDCFSTFKKDASPLGNTALVSALVEIADLRNPQPTYLSGPATCDPAP